MIRSASAEIARARIDGTRGVALAAGIFLLACDSPSPSPSPSAAPKPSASAPPEYVAPAPEGCARSGSLEAIESDPACVVPRVDEVVVRDSWKQLSFTLAPDAPQVLTGATILVRLAVVNTGATEASVVFQAEPPGAVSRPDWTRLAGVPEPKPTPSGAPLIEGFHLVMPLRTLDTHDRSVDGLPSTPPVVSATPRLLRVRLKPRARLTHTMSWWALRIPAPAPITRDDAGHRYVPKTAPVPLPPGEYTIALDLPLFGISAPESTVTTRIKVEAMPADAGTKHHH